jgi:hypothetical protein
MLCGGSKKVTRPSSDRGLLVAAMVGSTGAGAPLGVSGGGRVLGRMRAWSGSGFATESTRKNTALRVGLGSCVCGNGSARSGDGNPRRRRDSSTAWPDVPQGGTWGGTGHSAQNDALGGASEKNKGRLLRWVACGGGVWKHGARVSTWGRPNTGVGGGRRAVRRRFPIRSVLDGGVIA